MSILCSVWFIQYIPWFYVGSQTDLNRFINVSYKITHFSEEVRCGAKRDFVTRIKSALTHRGRGTNLKSATWKVGEKKHCLKVQNIMKQKQI